jgi:pilus assembly protein FimV
LIVKTHRWQKTAMAAAAAALLGLCGTQAEALSLGRITVQSSLGEPLRAEIEVPEINAEEAASLKASVALPEVFRAAGLEYNPAMSNLQASLQRRTDGRAFIRLSSDRAINEPFVDMIIEANWATGRIVRDYTMLFDPPSLRQASAPTPAQIPAQTSISKAAPAASTTIRPTATKPADDPRSTVQKTPSSPPPVKTPANATSQMTVKSGDTASKIAMLTKPDNISLDQMLVALLRANPTAFVGDNVNRIKAGSVVDIPTTEQAEAIPAVEATRVIVAQSKDFNDFRRKLAGSAPSTQVATADRKVSGSVQAQVEDKKTSVAAPDKLTLSKGAVKGQPAEELLAKERSAKEAASRAAEISKNIADLNKLGAASSAVSPTLTASTAALDKPDLTSIAAAVVAAAPAASAPVMTSSEPVQPASEAASSPAPVASAVAKIPAAVPVPMPEPGFVDNLLEDPLVPAGAAGLIALLAGFGFYRFRQRKNGAHVDSSFLESRLQPDSFFGASGGQSVDTNNQSGTGSSMVYSPSQLDAVDDVDPVAEADVYLAYGRDLQAEEILKDALRTNPGRVAIHQKLLEIFAKRSDTRSFEEVATQAFGVTSGNGADWDRMCELGRSIDPGNLLYQPGGQPHSANSLPSLPTPLEDTGSTTSTLDTITNPPQELQPIESTDLDLDLDLDLDFSLENESSSAITEAVASTENNPLISPEVDFGLATEAMSAFEVPQDNDLSNAIEFTLPDLDFGAEISEPQALEPSLVNDAFKLQAATSFGATGPAPLETLEPDTPPEQDLSMLDFDIGELSLDLGEADTSDSTASVAAHEDPLGTKLALAEEFRAIGDDDGARALIEEVISEATGDMKIKAQRALNSL